MIAALVFQITIAIHALLSLLIGGVIADVAARVTGRARAFPSYTKFAERLLRDRLTKGQRAFCLVAFEHFEPAKLRRSLRDVSTRIWGNVAGPIAPGARVIVVLVAGRGSGKTVLGLLRILYLGLTLPLPSLLEPA